MPPPLALLSMDVPPGAAPATLSLTRVSVSVKTPELSIPPPLTNAQGCPAARGQENPPGGIVVRAVTRLRVMTLSLIATVAPAALPADPGIETPPPATTDVEGCESLRPPVIVRRLSTTSRWLSPPKRSIVIPPWNVPGAIWIVSPSWAAFTAAWTVEKQPGFVSTHNVAVGAERAAE